MNATCEKLRRRIATAKAERNDALRENATDENNAQRPRHSQADVDALRLAVDLAALEARNAGCDVDDLVAPSVGDLHAK